MSDERVPTVIIMHVERTAQTEHPLRTTRFPIRETLQAALNAWTLTMTAPTDIVIPSDHRQLVQASTQPIRSLPPAERESKASTASP